MKYLIWVVLILLTLISCAQNSMTNEEELNLEEEQRMDWWREAKFGMFIHWGLYAVPANSSEWHMRSMKKSIEEYSRYAKQFNPIKFNAGEWARIANEAGMEYMVITAKHHDGFALFDSEASSYNMVDATPFKRDIIKELADACPKHDVRFGVYYSLMADWGHPGGGIGRTTAWDSAQEGDIDDYFNKIAFPQLKELLSNYGSLSEIWFDTDGTPKPKPDRAIRIDSLIKAFQPQAIVNSRVISGDFINAERHVPPLPVQGDWEACDLSIEGSWGYKIYKPKDVRPVSELIRQLVDVVSKGGNYLLNVGPKSDGTFPDDVIDQFRAIGNWIKTNGEAIYGTSQSPFDFLPWGRCTRKGDYLYLHVFDWPSDGRIKVPMSNRVISAEILGAENETVSFNTTNGVLELQVPPEVPGTIISVIKLKTKGEIRPIHSIALNKPVYTSFNVQVNNITDEDYSSYWESIEAAPCWIIVDLENKETFNTVRLGHGGGRISKVSLKIMKEGHWVTIFEDDVLSRSEYVRSFPKVTAQKVWFDIEEVGGNGKIRINSFELFNTL